MRVQIRDEITGGQRIGEMRDEGTEPTCAEAETKTKEPPGERARRRQFIVARNSEIRKARAERAERDAARAAEEAASAARQAKAMNAGATAGAKQQEEDLRAGGGSFGRDTLIYRQNHGGRAPVRATDGAPSTQAHRPRTGRELFIYRQNHGGRGPSTVVSDAGAPVQPTNMTARDLFIYRQNHGGRAPGEHTRGAR